MLVDTGGEEDGGQETKQDKWTLRHWINSSSKFVKSCFAIQIKN